MNLNEPEEEVSSASRSLCEERGVYFTPCHFSASLWGVLTDLHRVKGIAELSLPLQKKAPPPPPTSFPRVPQVTPAGPTGPPMASVNMFSRKAGNSYSRNQRYLGRTQSYGIQSTDSCHSTHTVRLSSTR